MKILIRGIVFLVGVTLLFSCKVNTGSATDNSTLFNNCVFNRVHLYNDVEKKAAYKFLKENMQWNNTWAGDTIDKFETIFEYIDSLNHHPDATTNYYGSIKSYYDSICNMYGAPNISNVRVLPDSKYMNDTVILENINWAFKMRDSTSWGRSISFDDFCNYVLPYRVSHEKYEPWRSHFYEMMQPVRDTTIAQNYWEYARTLSSLVGYHVKPNHLFWAYPFDISLSLIEKARLGACIHQVQYTTMLMRANGIPVGIDYVNRWANRSAGHHWCSLLMPDGTFKPFDPGKSKLEMEYDIDRVVAKVFRRTFTPNISELPIPISDEIPPFLYNFQQKDVTPEYKKTVSISVPLFPTEKKFSYAVISTFDNVGWAPIYFGKVSFGKALFENMGCGVFYQAKYYQYGHYTDASDPFLLDENGKICYYNVDESKKGAIVLKRKYPSTVFMRDMAQHVIGSKFQGANLPNFSDTVTLFTVDSLPEIFEEVDISTREKFKFVRYCSFRGYGEQMAEVEFYGLSKNGTDTIKLSGKQIGFPENTSYDRLFDGRLLSYFLAPRASSAWGGYELDSACEIVKLKYAARSDVNYIEVGHQYELCYWKDGYWVSMGMKEGKKSTLTYTDVPLNGLYLLHDHTAGKEERIFTYENGKQRFW